MIFNIQWVGYTRLADVPNLINSIPQEHNNIDCYFCRILTKSAHRYGFPIDSSGFPPSWPHASSSCLSVILLVTFQCRSCYLVGWNVVVMMEWYECICWCAFQLEELEWLSKNIISCLPLHNHDFITLCTVYTLGSCLFVCWMYCCSSLFVADVIQKWITVEPVVVHDD